MSYDFEVGSSQYGLCTSSSGYPNAFGWSCAVWFRAESLITDETFFGFHAVNDGQPLLLLRVDASNKLQGIRRCLAGNIALWSSTGSISTGTWHLATYAETSRTSRKLWLDTTEVTTDATDMFSDWADANDDLTRIGIACRPRRVSDGDVGDFFDGMVAEAAIWRSDILVQADVDALYGGALASSVAGGPDLWWRLNTDKGTSTYAADTGTGDMTLGGSPVYSSTHPSVGSAPSSSLLLARPRIAPLLHF